MADTLEQRIERIEIQLRTGAYFRLASQIMIGLVFIAIVIMVGVVTVKRLDIINDTQTERVELQDDTEAESEADPVVTAAELNLLRERAEDALDSISLLLSFLEGASVLLALGLGVAAFYGMRQSREVRDELKNELEQIQKQRDRIDDILEKYRPQLGRLSTLYSDVLAKEQEMATMVGNVGLLLQANQEFRLQNYNESFQFVERVLSRGDRDELPDNPQALYIAGWLEINHLNKLDDGLRHLNRLLELDSNWATARAAFGVALRRDAIRIKDEGDDDATRARYRRRLHEAHDQLRLALDKDFNLVDLEEESFWGPVGGIWRDLGEVDKSIGAYEKALQVTPGSSYPQGNLASLYLRKAQEDPSPDASKWNLALDAYELTLEYAGAELNQRPTDYWILMDMANASALLTQRDSDHLDKAKSRLKQALSMTRSTQQLETSCRGLEYQRDSLPDDPDWKPVLDAIDEAIGAIEERIEFLKASDMAIN